MQNESNIDKLVSAFSELEKAGKVGIRVLEAESTLRYKSEIAKYKEIVIKHCEEMIESSNAVIEEFEEGFDDYDDDDDYYISHQDILRCTDNGAKLYATQKNNFLRLSEKFKTVKGKTLDDIYPYFESFSKHCKDVENFINQAIQTYSDRYSEYLELKNTITIPVLPNKPTYIEPTPTYKTYTNADEILADMGECDIDNQADIYNALPNIVWYDNSENVITDPDLIVDKDNLENSLFFQSLLNVIKKKASSIKTAYEKSEIQPGYLLKMVEDIDNKLETILAKRFNEIFSKDNGGYSFKIKLGEQKISLCIFKNNEVMEIHFQSDGFRWFFNLFFFLHRKRLRSGDIVIMDEPAYNLSVPARYDCRKFLKSYGEANGITFLVITHDPYLIDIDHLDELRIVEEENKSKNSVNPKGANITNNFAMGNTQSNALQKIKKALGVSSHHVFCPPGSRIIYVEGITDYIYLTGFKSSYKKEKGKELKLAFIPINGIGNGHESIIAMLKELDENPIVLVDNDETGKSLRENLKKMEKCSVDIVSISGNHVYYDRYKNEVKDEIFISDKIKNKFEAFKTIESYFKEDEIKKYNLINGNNKKSIYPIAFKRALLNNENAVSEETKQNFYTLLEGLNEGL